MGKIRVQTITTLLVFSAGSALCQVATPSAGGVRHKSEPLENFYFFA